MPKVFPKDFHFPMPVRSINIEFRENFEPSKTSDIPNIHRCISTPIYISSIFVNLNLIISFEQIKSIAFSIDFVETDRMHYDIERKLNENRKIQGISFHVHWISKRSHLRPGWVHHHNVVRRRRETWNETDGMVSFTYLTF